MHENDEAADEPALALNRTLDIAVALILLAIAGVVIFDSVRIGYGWQEGLGPAPGYFPFWVAIVLAGSSLVNLFKALTRAEKSWSGVFVTIPAFGRVMTVVLPVAVFILAIGGIGPLPGLGIYVSSALFIAAFMVVLGREPAWKAIVVGCAIPLALFMMFERWFLVPLPKGPLEAMLGFA